MGSFAHVTEDGILRDIAPNLTMKIHYYDVVCGADESYLFPCEYIERYEPQQQCLHIAIVICK